MPSGRIAALLAAAALLAGCGSDDDDAPRSATAPPAATETTATTPDRGDDDAPARAEGSTPDVETLATDLDVPWDVAFLPDGRALLTERPGRLRLVSADGEVRDEPLADVEDVVSVGEGGLLGVEIDPDFDDNGFVYLYLTAADETRVDRYRLADGTITRETTILDGIDVGPIHDAGRLRFGPDGNLYVPTGDAGNEGLAQDEGSRNGKILRLTPAQARGDGPAEPEVVSIGHRNPQGLDWQPGTDRLVASEHGPVGDDEINVVREGENYGWPLVVGDEHGDFTAPIQVYEESIAPSGAAFVTRGGTPWEGDFLVAGLVGEQIRRIEIDPDGVAVGDEALFAGEFGRLRAVVEAPDGALWALTSNTDGRGDPTTEDDRLLRILPPSR